MRRSQQEVSESPTVAISDLVLSLRRQGVSVIDLGSGTPHFSTPDHITAEGIRALREGFTQYTPSKGLPGLLQAISDKLGSENGIAVDPATEIIVTPSSKHAIFISLMAILGPGDDLLVPTPSWVSYPAMARLARANPVPVRLRGEDDFRFSYRLLADCVTPRSRAIVINTPANPTGRVLSLQEAEEIARFAEDADLIIVTDEIYEKIVYDGSKHVSLGSLPGCRERTLTVNGFSKAYAMPGWRLGYVAGPADLISSALAVHQHTVACANSFVQRAGIAALTGGADAIRAMTETYEENAGLVVQGLNAARGITCVRPAGTFYTFPDIRGTGIGDSTVFAERLLSEEGVAVVPGDAFGPGGEGHVRISFAASPEPLSEAMSRIGDFCGRNSSSG